MVIFTIIYQKKTGKNPIFNIVGFLGLRIEQLFFLKLIIQMGLMSCKQLQNCKWCNTDLS